MFDDRRYERSGSAWTFASRSLRELDVPVFLVTFLLGKLSQFVLPVCKVTLISKRTISLQKVFAQTDLVKLVGFGSRSSFRIDFSKPTTTTVLFSVLLHLRQTQ